MPIYEYRCNACGHEMEILQKMSDPPLEVCPDCGEAAMVKQISAAGFRLKGGGWYETDFKSGKKKNIHDSGTAKKEGGAKEKPQAKSKPESKGSSTS